MFPNSINRRITQTQQRLQNGEFMSNIKISTKNLDLYYGENHALKNINMNQGRSDHRLYRSLRLR